MTIHIHQDDLPAAIDLGDMVAIDTETMGPHCFGINRNHITQVNSGGKIVLMDMNCHLCLICFVLAKARSFIFAKDRLFDKGARFGAESQ